MHLLPIWGARLLALATGYTLNDVAGFFSEGSEEVGRAVNYTFLLVTASLIALLAYIFITKK